MEKKGLIKINVILYMFGYSLKFDPKLTLRTLKHNKFYPPGVGEDGGLGIPEGRNRVTN